MKNTPIFDISPELKDPVSALPNEQSLQLGLLLLLASLHLFSLLLPKVSL